MHNICTVRYSEKERLCSLNFYYCKCSILLLVVVNILVYLIYKLNFVISMYVSEKHDIAFGMIHAFRHLLGVLECIPMDKGDSCNL